MSRSLTQNCFKQLSRGPLRQGSLPIYLAPAFSQPQRTQPFSTTSSTQSRVGGAPISVPPEVSLKFIDLPQTQVRGVAKDIPKTAIEVKGPLGVSEGHVCILSLVGVGYRATVESTATTVEPEYPGQQFVSLKVGYSHPIELGVPQGVKASTPQPTRILLEGVNKNVVTKFAAEIREWRKPEPYKGKGIFINGETIKLKAKKIR
ncbi:unnamed protein product [Aspergillus oryzae]|uniref:Unnamed protein product n=2 Tax=Aspergillus oryzae TaxID=5062 RepID=A0AAN5BW65_ASPOZ|nr:unnamed protein product [Aspergillus oryzae]GMF89285.1 unnamed protein product [Aspergillus oryzae]GMG03055.1 unnamed protein product [Aspergillus oryzae]GMG28313.1 unnamed protein product [Aspergillus oryzae]GMG50882.1 unnamed protein product [Aspergillus oryzae var. brunneus]